MHVIETASVDENLDRAPSAIAIATSRLTAPCFFNRDAGTPSWLLLTPSAYAIAPPRKYAELPGTSVISDPSSPPVHDSATEIVAFFFNDTATTEIYTLSLHDALPI